MMKNVEFTEFYEHTQECYTESRTAKFLSKFPFCQVYLQIPLLRQLPHLFPTAPFLSQLPFLYKFPQQNKSSTEEPTAEQNLKHLITS